MSSKLKAYSIDHSYNARKFDALFRAINNITFFDKDKNFTKALWIQANQTEIVINEKFHDYFENEYRKELKSDDNSDRAMGPQLSLVDGLTFFISVAGV